MAVIHRFPSDGDARELASRLKQRIIIQQPIETADGVGGTTRSWNDVATVWAELVPLRSGRGEALVNRQLEATVTHRVTIRYRADVTTAMRINYGGRVFNIRSVTNIGEANVTLEMLAEEGVAV